MGIWSRLESVINSYVNDFSSDTSQRLKRPAGDPDLDAAYEELDDYLNRRENRSERAHNQTQYEARQSANAGAKLPPQELRADFECLGVSFGADAETCKAAYKKLLKIHHPDRHAGHEGNFKKATERSARINASWDRIEKWRKSGSV
jgi:DnaJ-domain-containing protein 1